MNLTGNGEFKLREHCLAKAQNIFLTGSRIHRLNTTFHLQNSTFKSEILNININNKSIFSLNQSIHRLEAVNKTFTVMLNDIFADHSEHRQPHIKSLYIICGFLMMGISIALILLRKSMKSRRRGIVTSPGVNQGNNTEFKDLVEGEIKCPKDTNSSSKEIISNDKKLSESEGSMYISEKYVVNNYNK